MSCVILEELAWDEAEPVLRSGRVGILPIGARLKEHGLHLPLNNDWLLAEYFAKRVSERCEGILLPTLPHGYYPAFVEYPGSVSLSLETFRDTIVQVARSLARHGLRRLYVLNTGISTCRSLEPARQALLEERVFMDYTILSEASSPARKQVETQRAGTHADEIETSMMLVIAPDRVRKDRARPELRSDGPGPLTRVEGKEGVYSPTGAWGDPTLANVEKGRAVVEAIVDHAVASIQELGGEGYQAPPARVRYL